jgi:agmatine/peptidylarginine deiminase
MADDDFSGHIDNFCCFVGAGGIVLTWCDDLDEQYHRC